MRFSIFPLGSAPQILGIQLLFLLTLTITVQAHPTSSGRGLSPLHNLLSPSRWPSFFVTSPQKGRHASDAVTAVQSEGTRSGQGAGVREDLFDSVPPSMRRPMHTTVLMAGGAVQTPSRTATAGRGFATREAGSMDEIVPGTTAIATPEERHGGEI
ncbi:hypothetical protein BP6252_13465 [Coleophoma cylindrospora]|uniref:Uncharacterized protein n=1 Tax=Coleophoma cylindrospora TaxID=1849047 RepID=A0A3D8Q9C5_9HELO|nr:hypothetical protein BP6252_13465 [Coleophoma cylindrospora]